MEVALDWTWKDDPPLTAKDSTSSTPVPVQLQNGIDPCSGTCAKRRATLQCTCLLGSFAWSRKITESCPLRYALLIIARQANK